jgi:hypothetical protein
MLIARSLIDAARDRHSSFDRYTHPDALVCRYLSQLQRTLVGSIRQHNPNVITAELELALPPTLLEDEEDPESTVDPWERGVPLPPHSKVLGGTVQLSRQTVPPTTTLVMVDWGNRLYPRFRFSASVDNGRLWLTGSPETWGGDVTSITIKYVPTPPDLVALDDELLVPDSGELAVIEHLAYFMARRTPEMNASAFAQAAQGAVTEFLQEIASARRAKSIRKLNVQFRR